MAKRTRRRRITLKRRGTRKKQAGGVAFNMPWPFSKTKTPAIKQVSAEFTNIIKFLSELKQDQLNNLLNNSDTQNKIKELLNDSSTLDQDEQSPDKSDKDEQSPDKLDQDEQSPDQ